jgi:carboxylesterase
MSNYSTLAAAIVRHTRAREDVLVLMDDCHSRLLLKPRPSAKVCLFFHGFTATPEQFVPIGEVFFKAGYNVLIPLLPGHGQAGNMECR